MSVLDWVFVAVLGLSVLIGAWRGFMYELLSLLGWIAAFVVAQWLAPDVAGWLPMGEASQPLRYAVGFVLLFIVAVFAAGLVATLVRRLVSAIGLRPADRVLGTAFGVMRGVVIVLAIAVVFLLVPLTSTPTWRESAGAPLAVAAIRGLKPMLPERFGRYLPG
ncbi:CvpA family protein [Ramlibacter rhizophilus]|uniref:CvpA family protein n=1 Tax=Ramlibacter rhizophilus TaxID=1781167 RepID=A0A4Z0BKW1_9BURK|nr:CvpA family protein [Ramlibacter rhizophilus]TFY99962.1 CvpA family protein [Ramlibacter rhizophilus]